VHGCAPSAIAHFGNSGRVLSVAKYRPTGAANGRGIVDTARCPVMVYWWVWVSGRAASSARSAERATCGRTGMARSGPVPGVTSSCRAAKAANSPRGARSTGDGEHRRRTRGGPAQGRPGPPAGGCRPGSRIVTSLVPRCRNEAAAPLDTGSRLGAPGWKRLPDCGEPTGEPTVTDTERRQATSSQPRPRGPSAAARTLYPG
jgi:hypothetical protein